jgi:alkanesulfonate monooxygenase SsuD/methylene tetrahydromethanopterin reductase-like flavin-dependent oxidoreductase (luciferase family)
LENLGLLNGLTPERKTSTPSSASHTSRKSYRASIDVAALAESSEGGSHWIKPPSGRFQTIEDLEGLLIVGNPDDCAVEIEKFRARGVEHLVFDLRLQYDRYEESLELIGKELLPRFR